MWHYMSDTELRASPFIVTVTFGRGTVINPILQMRTRRSILKVVSALDLLARHSSPAVLAFKHHLLSLTLGIEISVPAPKGEVGEGGAGREPGPCAA